MQLKKISYFAGILLVISVMEWSCHNPVKQENAEGATSAFVVGVKAMNIPDSIPFIQSCAWAIQGNKLLVIGGRIEGFHGLSNQDTVFSAARANSSIWVIDLSNFTYKELPLNPKDTSLLQFTSSNMEFCRDGDTLYLVGGYGLKNSGSIQSNYTFNRMIAINIPAMIQQVNLQRMGNAKKAIIGMAYSPFLQVTGGELIKNNGTFYLMFGQDYEGVYQNGLNGDYISAVRKFNFTKTSISDTSSYTDTILHRRDITVAPVIQKSGSFYAGFGGVFTADNNGYLNPVYIHINNGSVSAVQDTLTQLTSQYICANATIYNPATNTNVNILFGGIGRYQYDTATKKWLDGDNGAKLPFVKTITQMIYQNGSMHQFVQLPPQLPELPGYIGADAIFIPDPSLLYKNGVIDYSKITSGIESIGIIYGGIRSIKPTSSDIYPTSVNKTVYKVMLYKIRSK
jgi:hypothetical protein